MADENSLDEATIAARLDGHPWDAITNWLASAFSGTADAGYTPDQVADYWAAPSPSNTQDQLDAAMKSQAARDPKLVSGTQPYVTPLEQMSAARIAGHADTEPPPAQMPEPDEAAPANPFSLAMDGTRSHYADALFKGKVRDPLDFAERYAGAVMSAAGDLNDAQKVSLVRAAGDLASQLPTNEALTDQAIAIAHDSGVEVTPQSVRTIKGNLLDKWAQTGDPLDKLYQQTYTDPEFLQSLTEARDSGFGRMLQNVAQAPFVQDPERVTLEDMQGAFPAGAKVPTLDELQQRGRDAIEKVYFVPGEELPDEKTVTGAITDLGVDVATVAGLNLAARYVVLPVARAIGSRLGEIPEYLRPLTDRIKVALFDPDAAPGELPRTVSATEAFSAPKPAVIERAPATEEGGAGTAKWAEDAEPIEKLQALSQGMRSPNEALAEKAAQINELEMMRREITPDEFASPTFFQRLAAKEDQPTRDLAEGYDAAAGTIHYWRGVFSDLLADTRGTVEPRTPSAYEQEILAREQERMNRSRPEPQLPGGSGGPGQRPLAYEKNAPSALDNIARETEQERVRRASEPRDVGGSSYQAPPAELAPASRATANAIRDMLIRYQARGDQDIKAYGAMMDKFRKFINPYLPEWKAELAKPKDVRDPMGTVMGRGLDMTEGRRFINAPAGDGGRVAAVFDPNHPLTPAFNVQREINDEMWSRLTGTNWKHVGYSEPGYVQDYWSHMWKDPLDAEKQYGARQGSTATLKERSIPTTGDGLRMGLDPAIEDPFELQHYRIGSQVRYANHLDMLDYAIENGFAKYSARAPAEGWVRVKGRSSMKPGPDGETQSLWMPKGGAKLYNNAIDGWYNYPAMADTATKLMWLRNQYLMTKLAPPIWHSFLIGEQVVTTGVQDIMSAIGRGQVGKAGAELWKTATFAPKFYEMMTKGMAATDAYLRKSADPVITYLRDAGWVPGVQIEYETRIPDFFQSWQNNVLGNSFSEKVSSAFRMAGRQMIDEVKATGGRADESAVKRLVMAVPRVAGMTFRNYTRAVQTTSAPLFRYTIPPLKAGVQYNRLNEWMRVNPTASPEQIMTRARQIVGNVEDRYGEMNQNNLFWGFLAKQAINFNAISTSWAYGTWRWTLAAMGRNIERHEWEWNPEATQAFVANAAAFAGINGVLTYLFTGQMPHGFDFALFRTDDKHRALFPTEFKEYFDVGKILATAIARKNPMYVPQGIFGEYLANKQEGIPKALWELLVSGEDAIGHKISFTPSGVLGYLWNMIEPASIAAYTHAKKQSDTGLTPAEQTLFRPAPEWLGDTSNFMAKQGKLADKWTKEELSRAKRENAKLELPDNDLGPPNVRQRSGRAQRPAQAPTSLRSFEEKDRQQEQATADRLHAEARAHSDTLRRRYFTMQGQQQTQVLSPYRTLPTTNYRERQRQQREYIRAQRRNPRQNLGAGDQGVGGGAQGV